LVISLYFVNLSIVGGLLNRIRSQRLDSPCPYALLIVIL
jgi:hypothetical protein